MADTYKNDYIAPILVVDSVIFQLANDGLTVLLIQRAKEPFKGSWALPGGYNPAGETTLEALERVTFNKTGVKTSELSLIEQLYTFDTIARDPRGHAVSVTYLGLGRNITMNTATSNQNPKFHYLSKLPELAYDHESIISYAHERLKSKVTYTNAVFALLPELFTLTQLQNAYEAIFGHKLDKRNFRKKFLSLNLIRPTEEFAKEGAHRPAQLFRFNQQKLQTLIRNFE